VSWEDISLATRVVDGLTLKDPFWIASAHFSEPSMFKVWAEIGPAALTLKTTTKIDLAEPDKKRKKGKIQELVGRYGRSYYSEAPKSEEFYPYSVTAEEHLARAKKELPSDTKIGVSVLGHRETP
jgi:dihydroorotate dehydrogenase